MEATPANAAEFSNAKAFKLHLKVGCESCLKFTQFDANKNVIGGAKSCHYTLHLTTSPFPSLSSYDLSMVWIGVLL